MKKINLVFAFIMLISFQIRSQDALTKIASSSNVEATVKKLTSIIESKGLKVFTVIDHKKGAESASMELLPTTLIIFGNPSAGTKLMNCDQTVGADLPMKFLVWKDKDEKTWIGYWKPSLLEKKYNLEACQPVLTKMDGALEKFASLAAE
jgi:uncharacterized protein (DUF302 family)